MKSCIYAGSFDPPTIGHLWVINQAASIFDEVVVAVGTNPAKKPMFTYDERMAMLVSTTAMLGNVKITEFPDMLLIKYAEQLGIPYIIRGIRNVGDFEYELQMRQVNGDLCQFIQTIFLIPPRPYVEISSSLVKSLIGFDGWEEACERYVPPVVLQDLKRKVGNKV